VGGLYGGGGVSRPVRLHPNRTCPPMVMLAASRPASTVARGLPSRLITTWADTVPGAMTTSLAGRAAGGKVAGRPQRDGKGAVQHNLKCQRRLLSVTCERMRSTSVRPPDPAPAGSAAATAAEAEPSSVFTRLRLPSSSPSALAPSAAGRTQAQGQGSEQKGGGSGF
jgi:hypothetical protein